MAGIFDAAFKTIIIAAIVIAAASFAIGAWVF